MNENLFNISSSPHVRQDLNVRSVMLNVVIALLPTTVYGIYHFGTHAGLIVALAVLAAVLTEAIFDLIVRKPLTIKDCSAVVTGLLLALSLPSTVPLYVPVLGSVFAIVVVKGVFGGLGKNFMNPALAARCFLLISFGTAMTKYVPDGVSGATPLADLRAENVISVAKVYLGNSYSVIGGSALCLLIGGLYLWVSGGITLHIPAAILVSFTAFIAIFGGQGFDVPYLLTNIFAGGILMGAFFMATDPVTSPMTDRSQILYGIIVGVIAALFRVKGSSPDSVSYAIIISNMFVPALDKLPVPKPLGYKNGEYKEFEFPKAAVNLCVITLVAGLILSSVYAITKQKIADQQVQKNAASYQEVLANATDFGTDEAISKAVEESVDPYDSAYGKTKVNDVVVGKDASGEIVGYVANVTTHDGKDGDIDIAVGLDTTGAVTGISFTKISETPGIGDKVEEDSFKGLFVGQTDVSGVDTIAGSTISSKATINAVSTALAFYNDHIA